MSGKIYSTLESLLDEVMLNDFDAYKQIMKESKKDFEHIIHFKLNKKINPLYYRKIRNLVIENEFVNANNFSNKSL